MLKTLFLDTNVIIRFLRGDKSPLFEKAKEIFLQAQGGGVLLYFDEVVMAEVIWTLTSFYEQTKRETCDGIADLISQEWVVNPRKRLIIEAIKLFSENNLSFIDCWIFAASKGLGYKLETFDAKLKKLDRD